MESYKCTILFLFCFISLVNCAQNPTKPAKLTQAPLRIEAPTVNQPFEGTVTLALKAENGQREVTQNCSKVVTETFDRGQILRQRTEELDFQVLTVTTGKLPNGNLLQNIETIQRDGPGSLHDLAFPEEGEVIPMEVTPQGNVMKAGRYPKDSLFYLPSIPLPDHPVKMNEDWVLKNNWKSETSGASLVVDLHLKAIGKKTCGTHTCVNVVVNGEVHFPALKSKTHYTHKITGRFLIDVEKGLVPWSEFGSEEQVQAAGAQALVHSKLRSELFEPPGYRTANHEEPACPFENKE
jgi:hypothetical protein